MISNIQDVAFAAGILLGAILLFAVSWVWFSKQVLGANGIALALIGFALMGLTVWTSIRVEATPDGFVAEFEQRLNELNNMIEEVDSNVERVASSSLEVSEDVENLRGIVATNGRQFQMLTMELEQSRAIPEAALGNIREGVTIPRAETEALDVRRRQLEAIIGR